MIYAEVIGDPISHSKSPLIHKFWLAKLGLEGDYRATLVPPDDLEQFIARRTADPKWRGCNVTIPHKIAVMDHVADPGDVRQSIGAMNTIARVEAGNFIGTNTDAAGFYAPIADLKLEGASVAVIGSGGAAHAVLFALSRCDVGNVSLLARNPLKGAGLLARFGLKGSIHKLDAPLPPVSLLVNATSLGMTGQAPLSIDLSPLPEDALVYDLVYAPLLTPLLAAAEQRGLDTVDGLEMLIGQAAFAFELFFGAAPPRQFDDELRKILVA
ncbi:shikimate dehydrogenase [Sphingomonas paeninsulae]|uniref:Shikimate dehydrogenase (NADP(+)) n=1 Tax=Sphingomonas paeninsulae TaxID=2319844 RepID=A0A494TGP6_SPHPE|nr:shikimate dehydrogenase [Sphingomonas paeninsulae]AYJ86614.1 shikimate dehydrogenase [Sphingomonas paeninsulae]